MQNIKGGHKIRRISGETGNRLAYNTVYFPFPAVSQKSFESNTLILDRSRNSIIGVNPNWIPVWIVFDQLMEIPFLRFVGVFLVTGISGNSNVSGYIQMPFLFLCPAKRSCGNKSIFFFHCFCLWLEDRLELASQPTDPFHNRNCLLHFLLCSQRLLDQGSNSGISVFLGFG